MKKPIVLAIAFLALSFSTQAQEPFVEWGAPINKSELPIRVHELFQLNNENELYALQTGKEYPALGVSYLEKFDKSFKSVYTKRLPIQEGKGEEFMALRYIAPMKDKFAAFYVGFQKSTKENFFVMRSISPATGEVDKTTKTELERIPVGGRINSSRFKTIMSPDNSKMLLVTSFPLGKDVKYRVRLRVFDANTMKQIWQKEVEMSFDSQKGEVHNFVVDNAGNAYLAGRYVGEDKAFKYLFWTYSAANSQWKETALDLKGKKINFDEQKLTFNANGDVVFTGFLYEGFVVDAFNAVFYIRVNGKTQAIETVSQLGFGDVNAGEKENISFTKSKLRAVLSQSNGDILVIGENEYNSTVTKTTAPGTATYTDVYNDHSQEIRVLSINPNGAKNWLTKIGKDQKVTTTDPTARKNSFIYSLVNDRLYIVYNNFVLPQTPTQPLSWMWREIDGSNYSINNFARNTEVPTFMYIVESNGRLIYDDRKFGYPLFNLFAKAPYPMTLNTYVFLPVNNGIIMMAETTGRFQFGKIRF